MIIDISIYFYLYVCVWYTCKCSWVCRGQRLILSIFFIHPLILVKQGLSLHMVLINMVLIHLSLLPSQHVPGACLALPGSASSSLGSQTNTTVLGFMYALGIWSWVLMAYIFSFKLSSLMISVGNPSSVKQTSIILLSWKTVTWVFNEIMLMMYI